MFKYLPKIVLVCAFILFYSTLHASFVYKPSSYTNFSKTIPDTNSISVVYLKKYISETLPDTLSPDTCTSSSVMLKKAGKASLTDKRKKLLSAICAFPFPFGMIGLHRIYLGSAPYVPLIYIASLGGALGILPFIDFMVILFKKDISPYQNNSSVFMWVEK